LHVQGFQPVNFHAVLKKVRLIQKKTLPSPSGLREVSHF
jgi:hypothetical protein